MSGNHHRSAFRSDSSSMCIFQQIDHLQGNTIDVFRGRTCGSRTSIPQRHELTGLVRVAFKLRCEIRALINGLHTFLVELTLSCTRISTYDAVQRRKATRIASEASKVLVDLWLADGLLDAAIVITSKHRRHSALLSHHHIHTETASMCRFNGTETSGFDKGASSVARRQNFCRGVATHFYHRFVAEIDRRNAF